VAAFGDTPISENDVRDVFVLGAGFSRAIHQGMPLMRELSEVLADQFRQAFGEMDWRLPLLRDNVEVALSLLSEDQPWLSESENLRNRALFIEIAQHLSSQLRAFRSPP
jgi:hypothetical protein